MTLGTGVNSNQLTLLSTSLSDSTGSPFTVTMTTSLSAYPDATPKSTTFTITITACAVTSVTVTGQIPAQTYVIGSPQQTIQLPTYTQVPACNYVPTFTF